MGNYRISQMLLVALLLAVTAVGCGEKEPDTPFSIELSQPTLSTPASGMQFVTVTAEGSWTIAFSDDSWCSVSPQRGEGTKNNIVLTYEENSTSKQRFLEVMAINEQNDTVSAILIQAAGEEEEEEAVKPPVVTAPTTYTELPTVNPTASQLFVTHNTTLNGRAIRSYSLLFDKNEKIALWVAYPHCSAFMGSTKRTDHWAQDPSIPWYCQMQGTMNGYSRGHQIPSSDRTNSKASNELTFYYSNQTPQKQAFNGGVWVKLENQVKDWANACDTLYVVTGAALKTVGGNESVTYIDDKHGGTDIAVPNYYYKVLLRLENGKYSAAGYWFNHFNYNSSSFAGNIKSVDEIEALTGFDFFSNLSQELQDEIECVKSTSSWAE